MERKIWNKISEKIAHKPRNIFLIDALGAFISAILLVLVIFPFEKTFGMSPKVVLVLLVPAIVFLIYSLTVYLLNPKNWKPFLRFIAIANLLYCCLTFVLIILEFRSIKILGVAYFLSEILVILLLVRIEWKVIKQRFFL